MADNDDLSLVHFGWTPGGYIIRCKDCPPLMGLRVDEMPTGSKHSSRCRNHAVAAQKAARHLRASAPNAARPGGIYRHAKRGTEYRVLVIGELQASKPVPEGTRLVAYQCLTTGSWYFRPEDEFNDGRFASINGDPA